MELINPDKSKQNHSKVKTTSLLNYLFKAILLCAAPAILLGFLLLTNYTYEHEKLQARDDFLFAKETSDRIDNEIVSHIRGLELLAASSSLNDPVRSNDFYKEMQAFHAVYDSHVILVNPSSQMLLNTRAKYGDPLPMLPMPSDKAGRGSFAIAQATGKPGVGDIVLGPVAKEPLVSIAVPVKQDGESRFYLLNTFEASRFERIVSASRLPEGYSFKLIDGAGLKLALNPSGKNDAPNGSSIVVKSDLTGWSVSLSTPDSSHYREAAGLLMIVLFVALVTTLIGASAVAQNISSSVRSLTGQEFSPPSVTAFTEVELARASLLESDRAEKEALAGLRASEDSLKKSNENFDFAQKAAKAGTYEWDVTTNRTVWSDQLWPILGLEIDSCESNYDNWLMSIHPDDRDMAHRVVSEAMQQKREINTEWRHRDSLGQIRWVVSRAKPVLNEQGEILRYIGIVIDITDQKLVEESLHKSEEELRLHRDNLEKLIEQRTGELRESQRLLQSVIDYLPMAVTYLDAEGRFVFSNSTFQRWWLKTPQEICGKTASEVHGEDATLILNDIAEAMSGHEQSKQRVYSLPDGVTRHLWTQVLPEKNPDGTVKGIIRTVIDVSEIKNAQKALEESEALFRSLFENMPDGTVLVGPDGTLEKVNPATCSILGMSEDEIRLLGRDRILDVADPRFGRALEQLLSTGKVSTELNCKRKDGTIFPIDVTTSVVRDETGGGRTIIAFRDITYRKIAEQALFESEARLRAYFEAPLLGVASVTPEMRFIDANDFFCQLLGYSRQEVMGMTCPEFTHPEDLDTDLKNLALLVDGKTDRLYRITRLLRKDGVILWVKLSVSCIRNNDGSIKYFVAFAQDMSDEKRLEQALKDNLVFLETLLEAIPNPMWVKNTDGMFLTCNKAFAEFVGLSRDQIIWKTIYDVSPKDIAEECSMKDSELWNHPGVMFYEALFNHRDGALHPVIISKATFADSTGKVIGQVGVIQDISERLEAERERSELQDQLNEARKLASLGTLVGGIAHDFNNMLQVIIGYGELLMDDIEKVGANPKLLVTILNTAETAAEQVTKFMDLGQQSMIFPTPTDLNQKIRELESTISNLPNINQLEMDLFDGPAIIKQDPGQLVQIIMALAVNASEAMPDGGALSLSTTKVTVDESFAKVHYGAKAGPHVLLTVTDNGRGIDEAVLPQVFEPFFSTKERGDIKSMGLGLAAMRGIV